MFPRKAPKQDLVMCVRIREYIKTAEDVAVAVILNKVSQFFLQFVCCLTSSCSKSTHRAMKSLKCSPLFCRLKFVGREWFSSTKGKWWLWQQTTAQTVMKSWVSVPVRWCCCCIRRMLTGVISDFRTERKDTCPQPASLRRRSHWGPLWLRHRRALHKRHLKIGLAALEGVLLNCCGERLCQECQVHLDCFSGCSLVDVVTDMLYVRSAPSILHFILTDASNPRAPPFSSKWVTEQQKLGQVWHQSSVCMQLLQIWRWNRIWCPD